MARPMTRVAVPPNKENLAAWLQYFHDLRIGSFYRDRGVLPGGSLAASAPVPLVEENPELSELKAQMAKSKSAAPQLPAGSYIGFPLNPKLVPETNKAPAVKFDLQAIGRDASLFTELEKVKGDTLERIREDIGDCKRCRLCEERNKIVFGSGSAKADLVFVGEGPGRDEDIQGLPFVGRAGKLLTQMIEAMGLTRDKVYIANVVKCRPPNNRPPEKDEVATCIPFLLRQLEVIHPKVIVCLGSTAAQNLLGTIKSISHFRGQWFDFRGMQLMATYHPAYLLRNPAAKGDVWKDLQKVMGVLGLKVPKAVAKN
jgi:uracil-DNA glycosylase family 4